MAAGHSTRLDIFFTASRPRFRNADLSRHAACR